MSLEDVMRENTAVLERLLEALKGLAPLGAQKPFPTEGTKWPKVVEPPAPVSAQEEEEVYYKLVEVPAPAQEVVDYAVVRDAITAAFRVDKGRVMTALKKFDAARGPELKVEDYAAFLVELAA
jgi:hypothetical protein